MNIEVDEARIQRPLLEKLHEVVKQKHNVVVATMTDLNRRVLKNLYDAFEASKFEKRGLEVGWRYFLEDGTIAERINNKVSLYVSSDVQTVPVRTHAEKLPGVFTDLPPMSVRVSRRRDVDPATHPVMPVVKRQFLCRFTYVNDRGYEYIISVSSANEDGDVPQTLADAERGLVDHPVNDFSIRFCLSDYNHSTFFHVLNSLNLFVQCFNPDLKLSLDL
jgi:hypothetical protein